MVLKQTNSSKLPSDVRESVLIASVFVFIMHTNDNRSTKCSGSKKGKVFPYSLPSVGPGTDSGVQEVSTQVTISNPPGGRLPLLAATHAITFPAAEHHRPLAGTKLYCLVTEAHRCEQLAQSCYAAFAPSIIWTHDLLIASPTLHPLRHQTTWK